ncbi:MAG: hypothetical protein ACO38S_11825, partial [Gemmobacter sp.]
AADLPKIRHSFGVPKGLLQLSSGITGACAAVGGHQKGETKSWLIFIYIFSVKVMFSFWGHPERRPPPFRARH